METRGKISISIPSRDSGDRDEPPNVADATIVARNIANNKDCGLPPAATCDRLLSGLKTPTRTGQSKRKLERISKPYFKAKVL